MQQQKKKQPKKTQFGICNYIYTMHEYIKSKCWNLNLHFICRWNENLFFCLFVCFFEY